MSGFVSWMDRLPDILVYVTLALGAALENVVPAIPADSFVALGGFLSGAGDLDARFVALATWVANVTGALIVYRVSRTHGSAFFERGWGRYVLRPHQMERMAHFYRRWGLLAIFVSRFLPGIRAIVPVFAGATQQPPSRVLPPIVVASALWYSGLVWLGLWAGQNLTALSEALGRVNRSLALAAAVVLALAATWWWRSRRTPDD